MRWPALGFERGIFYSVVERLNHSANRLRLHTNYFLENLEDYSEEQGERFHQDISELERGYQEPWNAAMLADYYWPKTS